MRRRSRRRSDRSLAVYFSLGSRAPNYRPVRVSLRDNYTRTARHADERANY